MSTYTLVIYIYVVCVLHVCMYVHPYTHMHMHMHIHYPNREKYNFFDVMLQQPLLRYQYAHHIAHHSLLESRESGNHRSVCMVCRLEFSLLYT